MVGKVQSERALSRTEGLLAHSPCSHLPPRVT